MSPNPENLLPDPDLTSPELALLEAVRGRADGPSDLLRMLRYSKSLFYPGAGEDITPALRFARINAIDTIVYCDYSADRDGGRFEIEAVLRKFERESEICDDGFSGSFSGRLGSSGRPPHYHLRTLRPLHASELGQTCRKDFFPDTHRCPISRGDEGESQIVGACAEYDDPSAERRTITFLYLDTEAIQTYIHLWAVTGCAPVIVVIQDHGLGGLWTPFDGECLLYAAAGRLPDFLWLGRDSKPWPYYRRISGEATDRHSMHQSRRSLWQCTLADRTNPDSPLGRNPQSPGKLRQFRLPSVLQRTMDYYADLLGAAVEAIGGEPADSALFLNIAPPGKRNGRAIGTPDGMLPGQAQTVFADSGEDLVQAAAEAVRTAGARCCFTMPPLGRRPLRTAAWTARFGDLRLEEALALVLLDEEGAWRNRDAKADMFKERSASPGAAGDGVSCLAMLLPSELLRDDHSGFWRGFLLRRHETLIIEHAHHGAVEALGGPARIPRNWSTIVLGPRPGPLRFMKITGDFSGGRGEIIRSSLRGLLRNGNAHPFAGGVFEGANAQLPFAEEQRRPLPDGGDEPPVCYLWASCEGWMRFGPYRALWHDTVRGIYWDDRGRPVAWRVKAGWRIDCPQATSMHFDGVIAIGTSEAHPRRPPGMGPDGVAGHKAMEEEVDAALARLLSWRPSDLTDLRCAAPLERRMSLPDADWLRVNWLPSLPRQIRESVIPHWYGRLLLNQALHANRFCQWHPECERQIFCPLPVQRTSDGGTRVCPSRAITELMPLPMWPWLDFREYFRSVLLEKSAAIAKTSPNTLLEHIRHDLRLQHGFELNEVEEMLLD